jgi:hypothetical protein
VEAAQQQAEEAYRREQNRINEERYRDQAPYRAAHAQQAIATANYMNRRPAEGGGGADRTALATQRLTANALRTAAVQAEAAVNAARRARAADPTQRPYTPEEENTIRDTVYQRLLAGQNVPVPGGALVPPAAPAPAAQIDARGNPIR